MLRTTGARGRALAASARQGGSRVRAEAESLRRGPVGTYGTVLRHEAGGAWRRFRGDGQALPAPADIDPVRETVRVDTVGNARFCRCVGSPVGDAAHGGYLHALAFPVSMRLLADPALPLPLLGLVHLRNTVVQHRALPVGSFATVRSRVLEFGRHRKGLTVTVRSEIWDDAGRPVLTDDSLYLSTAVPPASGTEPGEGTEKRERPDPRTGARLIGRWRLPAGLGREYARASGDANPIHLSTVTARAFGMKRMLVHGMYSASRMLGETGDPSAPCRWEVEFATPVYLPSTVGIWRVRRPSGPGQEWRGIGSGGRPHFVFRRASLAEAGLRQRPWGEDD